MIDWSKDQERCCVMGESPDGTFRYIRSWRGGDLAYMIQALSDGQYVNMWPAWRGVWETVMPRITLNINPFDTLLAIENEQMATPIPVTCKGG